MDYPDKNGFIYRFEGQLITEVGGIILKGFGFGSILNWVRGFV